MEDKIGAVIGRGSKSDELEIVVAFQERTKAPRLGEFLVVEETEGGKRKLLVRVEEFKYGDFQATKDERIRSLVEKYIREITEVGRELSEEEKKALFFRHYILKVLGEIKLVEQRIKTEYRLLPELTSICRYPTKEEYKIITNAGLEDAENPLPIGHFSVGEEIKVVCEENVNVSFDLDKFKNRRSAIFARTGYGKSNLCKLVASIASLTGGGLLIFDMDGEYAFRDPTKNEPGLADIPGVKENLVVYTNRRDENVAKCKDVLVHSLVNLELLKPWQVASLFPEAGGEDEKAFIKDFRALPKVPESLIELVKALGADKKKEGELWKKLYEEVKTKKVQENALNRNLRSIMPLHDSTAPNIISDIKWHMARGRTVVVDLSLLPMNIAKNLSNSILEGLFKYNVENITRGKCIKLIAIFEEAQNVLSKKALEDEKSYFVRWAKEGRKYKLGLIYVTQQPGAIAEEIVSQTDNFFVMHLLGKGDIDALRRANPHYDGVISDFLSRETIVGNAYIYSAPKQPYVFPCKVKLFTADIIRELSKAHKEEGFISVLNEIGELQKIKGESSKFGEFSGKVYQYFNSKGIVLPFMDDAKKWLDYEIVMNLYNQLS